jgi:CHASE2 domain-containing sensor protein
VQQRPAGDHEARPFGYQPPTTMGGRPAVITWFRVYAWTTLVFIGLIGVLAAWQYLAPSGPTAGPPRSVVILFGLVIVTLAFGSFHAVAATVPYRPWGWTVGLIAICLGLGGCAMFAAIPLLVFWLKPETKAAFGRL